MSKYPAGWHPVPNSDQERYWNGSLWTDAYRPKSGQISPQVNSPVYPGQLVVKPPTSGMAIASMVLGIVWIYWIGSILAVIFGHISLSQMRQNPSLEGRGMAIAGVVLGWIGIGVLLIIIIVAIAAA